MFTSFISFTSLPRLPRSQSQTGNAIKEDLPLVLYNTALPGVMRYISSGQDACTTRVS